MKTKFFQVLVFCCCILTSACKDDWKDYVSTQVECIWDSKTSFTFAGHSVNLRFPSNMQFSVSRITDRITSFSEVFFYGDGAYIVQNMAKQTSIKITTKVSGCKPPDSKSKIYNEYVYEDIGLYSFYNQWSVPVAYVENTFDIIITAGPYMNENNASIRNLIWSKSFARNDFQNTPNMDIVGVFRTVVTKTVYIGNKIQNFENPIKLEMPAVKY